MEKDWDIWTSFFTHDGNYQITYVPMPMLKQKLMLLKLPQAISVDFPKFETGDVSNVVFSRDGSKARFYVAGSNTPSNLIFI